MSIYRDKYIIIKYQLDFKVIIAFYLNGFYCNWDDYIAEKKGWFLFQSAIRPIAVKFLSFRDNWFESEMLLLWTSRKLHNISVTLSGCLLSPCFSQRFSAHLKNSSTSCFRDSLIFSCSWDLHWWQSMRNIRWISMLRALARGQLQE